MSKQKKMKDRKFQQWLAAGLILIWSGVFFVACGEPAIEVTPTTVTPPHVLEGMETPDIPPATLTEEALQQFIATSLAEHPRVTPTSELSAGMLTANAANQVSSQAQVLTRQASNAALRTIIVHGEILVEVHMKTGQGNLLIAFSGLNQGGQQFFPELLLGTQNDKNDQMDDNDWWFQAAAAPCWGSGPDAVWQQCGAPQNWRVSAWTADADAVEMAIPYATIGLTSGDDNPIGLAFALLSVTADGREIRAFWPGTAELNAPRTWGAASAADGW